MYLNEVIVMDGFDPQVGNLKPVNNRSQPMGVAVAGVLVWAGAVYDVVLAVNYGAIVNVGLAFMAAAATVANVVTTVN